MMYRKRFLSLLLALVMLLTMTACGGKEDEVVDDGSEMTIDPNQSDVAVKAADTVFTY